MSNQYISFDTTKQSSQQSLIVGRQGDSQLKTITVSLWNGKENIPEDLTGLANSDIEFQALKPDDTRIIDSTGIFILDATIGLFRYQFPKQVFAASGNMKQAFFKINRKDNAGNKISDSTLEIPIKILDNNVENGIDSSNYFSDYDKLVLEIQKKFDDFSSNVNKSVIVAQQTHDEMTKLFNQISSLHMLTLKDTSLVADDIAYLEIVGLTSDTSQISLKRVGGSTTEPPISDLYGYIETNVKNIAILKVGDS